MRGELSRSLNGSGLSPSDPKERGKGFEPRREKICGRARTRAGAVTTRACSSRLERLLHAQAGEPCLKRQGKKKAPQKRTVKDQGHLISTDQ